MSLKYNLLPSEFKFELRKLYFMFRTFQFYSKEFEKRSEVMAHFSPSMEISHYFVFELICIQFGKEMHFKLENPNFIGENPIRLKTDDTEKHFGKLVVHDYIDQLIEILK